MMSILIFALIVIIILALFIYGAELLPVEGRLIRLLQLAFVAIAIIVIAQRAGIV